MRVRARSRLKSAGDGLLHGPRPAERSGEPVDEDETQETAQDVDERRPRSCRRRMPDREETGAAQVGLPPFHAVAGGKVWLRPRLWA